MTETAGRHDRALHHHTRRHRPLTLTAPANGSAVNGTTTVTGTTAPDAGGRRRRQRRHRRGCRHGRARRRGPTARSRSSVPTASGTDVITVAATAPNRSDRLTRRHRHRRRRPRHAGVRRRPTPPGTTTVRGPTTTRPSADFARRGVRPAAVPGLDAGRHHAYLRVHAGQPGRRRSAAPLGAQLVDVYIHVPGVPSTSTAAALRPRNYTIAPSGAWSQRIEVQGFDFADVGERRGYLGRHRVRPGRRGRQDDHRRVARGTVRHPDVRLELQRWC